MVVMFLVINASITAVSLVATSVIATSVGAAIIRMACRTNNSAGYYGTPNRCSTHCNLFVGTTLNAERK
jgi:hypothetical protein